MPDIALLGVIPIKIVKSITHAIGNVAVGHSVGRGVRLNQTTASPQPERVQLRCTLLGSDKYRQKFAIEQLHYKKIPFPFISKLASLPFVIIESLMFTENSNRKEITGGAAFDFVITLQEFKSNYITKLGAKIAWLTWATATYPDPSTNTKLYVTPPTSNQDSASVTTESMLSNAIDIKTAEKLGDTNNSWNVEQLNAANTLNRKFDKIPFDPNGVFPQVIKLQYPSDISHYSSFNNVAKLPSNYTGYKFPMYKSSHSSILTIKILPKESKYGNIVSMIVENNKGETLFSRKILPEVLYKIGIYTITFNEIDIKSDNINPKNEIGGDYGSKLEGGIRI